jgi:menaquinone-dependent protoporphyrinogen IX oxidase
MEKKILVTYATIHGSTREIAEEIASTLKHDGVLVDIQPASKVTSLDEICMVILGAPQYMFHLQKDALRFLGKFRKIIEKGLPVAIFTGGSIEKDSSEETRSSAIGWSRNWRNSPGSSRHLCSSWAVNLTQPICGFLII